MWFYRGRWCCTGFWCFAGASVFYTFGVLQGCFVSCRALGVLPVASSLARTPAATNNRGSFSISHSMATPQEVGNRVKAK